MKKKKIKVKEVSQPLEQEMLFTFSKALVCAVQEIHLPNSVPMNTQFIILTVYSYSFLSNLFFFKCDFNLISCFQIVKIKGHLFALKLFSLSAQKGPLSSWNAFYPGILQNKSLISLNCRQFFDNCLSWILPLWP